MPLPLVLFPALTAAGTIGALGFFRIENRVGYTLAKGLASAAFVATALLVGAATRTWSAIVLAGLVLAAAGDVVLALRSRSAFLGGLGLFAAAYAAYTGGFIVRGVQPTVLVSAGLAAAVATVAGGMLLAKRLPRAILAPACVYLAVILAMAVTALATASLHGRWLLPVGAVLLVGSDLAVVRERFVASGFANKLVGLPAYYLGQVLIALSLAASYS